MEKLNEQKKELERLVPEKFAVEREIEKIQREVSEEEECLKLLQELDIIDSIIKLEKEKINIHIKSKEELEKKRLELVAEADEIMEVQQKPKVLGLFYLFPILLSGASMISFILNQPLLGSISVISVLISIIMIILKKAKLNKEYTQELEEIRKIKQDIENRKTLVENEIKAKDKLIQETQNLIIEKEKKQRESILSKYSNVEKITVENFHNKLDIFEQQKYINNLKLIITQKEYTKNQIAEKLENLVEIEEELKANEEILQELIKYDEAINLAKEALEEAHIQMKESITPKFTKNLSNLIESITARRYKKVKVSEDNGLILEAENRKLCNS